MWLSVLDVPVTCVQLASKLPVLFFLYSQRTRFASPVTDEAMVSSPLPAPAVAVGVAGFGGRVGKLSAVASSVEQPLSLYALKT